VAVFCHHHLLRVNGFIDKHILTNGEALLNLLKGFSQVKSIAHGHVHQQRETIIERHGDDNLHLWATPSTSVQFKPNSHDKGNDDLGPAFRQFALHPDGSIDSQVVWLDTI
jgi:Icc protein